MIVVRNIFTGFAWMVGSGAVGFILGFLVEVIVKGG